MQPTHPSIDFARGAAHHLRGGLDHYQALEIERGSWLGNPTRVAALERQVAFELAWAVADIERALPAVGASDANLGAKLAGARDAASQVLERIPTRTYSPTPPFSLRQGLRDAYDAVALLERASR